jgi:hypothetical protein
MCGQAVDLPDVKDGVAFCVMDFVCGFGCPHTPEKKARDAKGLDARGQGAQLE